MGQEKDVRIYRLVTRRSVEEHIRALASQKLQLQNQVLDAEEVREQARCCALSPVLPLCFPLPIPSPLSLSLSLSPSLSLSISPHSLLLSPSAHSFSSLSL